MKIHPILRRLRLFCVVVPIALHAMLAAQDKPEVAADGEAPDVVVGESAPAKAKAGSKKAKRRVKVEVATDAEGEVEVSSAVAEDADAMEEGGPRKSRGEVVEFGQSVVIATNETASVVVVIGGNLVVDGVVTGDAVVIGGKATVNGTVRGELVSPVGRIVLGDKAIVDGDVVSVAGGIMRSPSATIGGDVVSIPFPGFAEILDGMPGWVSESARELFWKARPLSFHVGWVWGVLGVFLVAHAFVRFVFPKAVATGVAEVQRRPATSFFAGLLSLFVLPILLVVTSVTIILPLFLLLAAPMLVVFGKVVVESAMGGGILRQIGLQNLSASALGWLTGTVLVVGLYLVPFLGLLSWMLLGIWSLGAGVMGLYRIFQGENDAASAVLQPTPAAAIASTRHPMGSAPGNETSTQDSGFPGLAAGASAGLGGPSAAPDSSNVELAPERATNGVRFVAGAIDFLLVTLLTGWTGGFVFVAWVAYFTAMWRWRETTLGGVIMGVQVRRQDGLRMDFVTAFVRALAWLLGLIPCWLGWLWALWDPNRQAWHDKLSASVAVRNPGISLMQPTRR